MTNDEFCNLRHSSFVIRHLAAAAALIALSVALFTAAIYWNPVGPRHDGRVMVVERHSTWEPTTKPYDTTWFGEPSGYNYAAIYDYLGQYYRMSRLLEKDKIDDATLAKCDVLVDQDAHGSLQSGRGRGRGAVRRTGRRAAADRRSHELRAVGHDYERHHAADGLHLPRRSAV